MTDNKDKPAGNALPPKLTPHELMQKHMEHPDEPITDAAMKNIQSGIVNATSPDGVPLTEEQKRQANELAKAIESEGTGMSYQAGI